MATTDTGGSREIADAANVAHAEEARAGALLPALLIVVALALVGFGLVLSVVELAVKPVLLPPPFSTENQKAETAIFLLSIVLVLPASLIGGLRAERMMRRGPNAAALPALGWLIAALPAAGVLALRVLPGGGGVGEALAFFVALAAGLTCMLVLAAREPRLGPVLGRSPVAGVAAGLTAALLAGDLLVFTTLGSLAILPLVAATIVAAAIVWIYLRRPSNPSRLAGRRGVAVDVLVVIAVLLTVPQLDVFGNPGITTFHQNLWLGPASRVLSGHALLVDNASQYGIGSVYLLAGWFKLAPIGYGTLSFLDGVLFGLFFATGYGLLRLAGVARKLAVAAIALAVLVLTYNLLFPVGTIPQHGPIRFGLPLVLVAAATWEARARVIRLAWGGQLAVIALSSVWMFEAFGYTVLTFAGLLAVGVWGPDGRGLRWAARRALAAFAAIAGAQLVFVLATVLAAGDLPDYGLYFTFLHAFLVGPLSHFTFDFSRWSPGLLVGFAYALNVAAVVLLVRLRADVARRRPAELTALAGLAAFGLVLFSYFVDRSQDLVLPYVSLPLLLSGAIWLDLVLNGGLGGSRSSRAAGLAAVLAVAVLTVSVAWSSLSPRFSSSLAGHVVPGGESIGTAFHRLWHPPPLDPASPAGVKLLDRYAPGESTTPVLLSSTPGVEVLLRSGRANALPFSDPLEDSFASLPSASQIAAAVDRLRAGQRVLTQVTALGVLASLRADPGRDLRSNPVDVGDVLTLEQEQALQDLAARFRLRVLDRGPSGFVVLELARKRQPG